MKYDAELYDEISSSEDWVSSFYDKPSAGTGEITLEKSYLTDFADENSLTFINIISFILNPPPTAEAPLNKTKEILNQPHFNILKPISDNFLSDSPDLKSILPIEASQDSSISAQTKLYLSDSNFFIEELDTADKLEDYSEPFQVEKPAFIYGFNDAIASQFDVYGLNGPVPEILKQDAAFDLAESAPEFISLDKSKFTESSQLFDSSYLSWVSSDSPDAIEIEKNSRITDDPIVKETIVLQEREFQTILENQEPLLDTTDVKNFLPGVPQTKVEFYKTQPTQPDTPPLENDGLPGIFENRHDAEIRYSDAISTQADSGIDLQELSGELNAIFEKNFGKSSLNAKTTEHPTDENADFQAINDANLGIFNDDLGDLTENKPDLPTYPGDLPHPDNQSIVASILNDSFGSILANDSTNQKSNASQIFNNLFELAQDSSQGENFKPAPASAMPNQEIDSLLDTEKTLVRSALADLKSENQEQYIEYDVPENWFRDNTDLKHGYREPDILNNKNSGISQADKLKIEIEGNLKILEDGRARITGIGFGAIPGK